MQASAIAWVVVIGAFVAWLIVALVRSPRRGHARTSAADAGAVGWFAAWSDGGGSTGGSCGDGGGSGGCSDGGGGGC